MNPSSRTGGLGGLTTQWTSETGGFTAQKPNLRTVEMQPKKPVFDLVGDGTYRLLGRPVIVSDVGNAASAVGDVIFVDLQSYILGIRAGMSIQTSAHLFFDFDAMAIRAIQRVDGSPKFMDKITQRDATTQNSWAVTIAA